MNERVKVIWNGLAVAGLLAIVCSTAFAQRYVPPSGTGGSTTNTTTTNKTTTTNTTTPTQHSPDPFGLALAASGAAAAVGYVLRRRRSAS